MGEIESVENSLSFGPAEAAVRLVRFVRPQCAVNKKLNLDSVWVKLASEAASRTVADDIYNNSVSTNAFSRC